MSREKIIVSSVSSFFSLIIQLLFDLDVKSNIIGPIQLVFSEVFLDLLHKTIFYWMEIWYYELQWNWLVLNFQMHILWPEIPSSSLPISDITVHPKNKTNTLNTAPQPYLTRSIHDNPIILQREYTTVHTISVQIVGQFNFYSMCTCERSFLVFFISNMIFTHVLCA